jgi:molybdenum cofactor guanylyltransferase
MIVPLRRGAFIVAGGSSRRMGRSKAWLELGGRTLVAHLAEQARAAVPSVIVVGRAGIELPALPSSVRRVDDPEDAAPGPLLGVLAGLLALHEAHVELAAMLAVDQPAASARHVAFVLDRLQAAPAAEAVVPRVDGVRQPFAGALRTEPALAAARVLVDAGERSVQALFDGLATVDLAVADLPDPRVTWPCNTPEQWAALVEALP